MAHPFHHALSSAKKWGGGPEDYLLLHQYMDQSKAAEADFRHRAILHHSFGIFMLEQHFGPVIQNLHRPHRSCPIHRRTTCDRRFGPDSNICRLDPLHPPGTCGWAARSPFISRSIPSRAPLRQKDHDNVCDLSPPPPPRRRELACRRPRRRLAISATRTPRRLQTASKARLLPNNDRASRQRSVSRARVSPLTPPSTRLFNPKEPGPAPGSLLFGDTQWLTITHQPSSNKLFLMPT